MKLSEYVTQGEFIGLRSTYFKEVMKEFPEAREEELALALKHLHPQKNEVILEVGAGNGFFTRSIAKCINPSILVALDPSIEQLEDLTHLNGENICIMQGGADFLPLDHELLQDASFDAIWSGGGSFHHVFDKTKAFHHFYKLLKPSGRLVISDVFAGSNLAKYFDSEVAKYCATGHEVSFLSKEFADSLCHIAGFQEPKLYDATIHLKFAQKEDIGNFLFKIHAMIKTSPEECLKKAEKILGIDYINGLYCLKWPLSVCVSYKRGLS